MLGIDIATYNEVSRLSLPSFLYSAPKWLLEDLPGLGQRSSLEGISNGSVTLGAQTIAAASIPYHGWMIYDTLTVNGTVKWATPALKILCLTSLVIDTGGQLNGGGVDGNNASAGTSGAGAASTLAAGGAAVTDSSVGNPGSYNSGGSGGRRIGTGTNAGGGSTAFNRNLFSYKNTTDYLTFYTPSSGLYTALLNYASTTGASGGSATISVGGEAAGGGGGATSMSLIVVAPTITVGGNGIDLSGGDGGDAYDSLGSNSANGGNGGNGGLLIVLAQNAANGTRSVSGGAGGALAGGGSNGSAGSAGSQYWIVLE